MKAVKIKVGLFFLFQILEQNVSSITREKELFYRMRQSFCINMDNEERYVAYYKLVTLKVSLRTFCIRTYGKTPKMTFSHCAHNQKHFLSKFLRAAVEGPKSHMQPQVADPKVHRSARCSKVHLSIISFPHKSFSQKRKEQPFTSFSMTGTERHASPNLKDILLHVHPVPLKTYNFAIRSRTFAARNDAEGDLPLDIRCNARNRLLVSSQLLISSLFRQLI